MARGSIIHNTIIRHNTAGGQNRKEDADAAMASDADDEMEDGRSGGDTVAACRGQKRRLHTVCEISYAARSKMIKQLEHGIT